MLHQEGEQEARNTLGIGQPAYEKLIERLAADSMRSEGNTNRRYTRIDYHEPFVRLTVESENNNKRDMTLACRNISRGGIGLLHSSFMYPGTSVTVHLQRFDGRAVGLPGTVVRVEHRGGKVHEIGIRFLKEINTREFVACDITSAAPMLESVAPDKLSGSVVFFSKREDIKGAVRQHLLETGVRFSFVSNADELLAGEDGVPDMILIDLDLEGSSGPELVKKLRLRGIGCPVVLVGRVEGELDRSMVRVCGADAVLATPFNQSTLLRVLGEYLLSGWDIESLDKTRSRVDRATLVSLCFELNKLGVVLDQIVRKLDHVGLFGTCQKIRGLSMLVGMSGVSGMAERLGELASRNADQEQMQELIEQVGLGCAAAGRVAA